MTNQSTVAKTVDVLESDHAPRVSPMVSTDLKRSGLSAISSLSP